MKTRNKEGGVVMKHAVIERLGENGQHFAEFHPVIIATDGNYIQRVKITIPHGTAEISVILSISELSAALKFIREGLL